MKLASKVVKINSKIIIFLFQSKSLKLNLQSFRLFNYITTDLRKNQTRYLAVFLAARAEITNLSIWKRILTQAVRALALLEEVLCTTCYYELPCMPQSSQNSLLVRFVFILGSQNVDFLGSPGRNSTLAQI